jgi:1-acyl-sn-glycerol-3-phosphate acyltransferase
MNPLERIDSSYHSRNAPVGAFARHFPTVALYWRFLPVVFRASAKAKKHLYDGAAWCRSSFNTMRALEKVGCRFDITGLQHIARLSAPCVVVANHMSILETTILPALMRPHGKMTFVIKQSLLEYPVFKHVMHSRRPIVVNRVNPRQDLKTVLQGGLDRLRRGISIVVFPQTTRTQSFEPASFNSIGVKLALKANAPVVPLALDTAAWNNGKWIKEFGKIDPRRMIRFSFGPPMTAQGRGSSQHKAVLDYIKTKLDGWRQPAYV